MKLFKPEKKVETSVVECEECGHLNEETYTVYIPSIWSRVKRFFRVKILRRKTDLERANKILTEIYQPAITEQLYQESPFMKHLREKTK